MKTDFGLRHLADGHGAWCTCVALTPTDGVVVAGNLYFRDVVRLPPGTTWEKATRVSPYDVEIVFDAVTGHAVDPQYEGLAHLESSPDLDRSFRAWLAGLRGESAIVAA